MDAKISAFLSKEPELYPLFESFAESVRTIIPDSEIIVHKAQIAFRSGKTFCAVWLPIRAGIKGRPAHYFIVTFGLDRLIDSPRITDPVEPYPNRWTHHVIISRPEDIDTQLLDWISQAYQFKQKKTAG